MTDETDDDILDDRQAAELLRIGRKLIRKQARKGLIPCQIIGEEYRFSRRTLLAWWRGAKDACAAAKSAPAVDRRPGWQARPTRNRRIAARRFNEPIER